MRRSLLVCGFCGLLALLAVNAASQGYQTPDVPAYCPQPFAPESAKTEPGKTETPCAGPVGHVKSPCCCPKVSASAPVCCDGRCRSAPPPAIRGRGHRLCSPSACCPQVNDGLRPVLGCRALLLRADDGWGAAPALEADRRIPAGKAGSDQGQAGGDGPGGEGDDRRLERASRGAEGANGQTGRHRGDGRGAATRDEWLRHLVPEVPTPPPRGRDSLVTRLAFSETNRGCFQHGPTPTPRSSRARPAGTSAGRCGRGS